MAGRGRPAREPTADERKRIKALVAEGAPQRLMGKALGRSVPNLRKYFAAELELEKKSPPPPAPPAVPAFEPTEQMRSDVALMAACGEPPARIAKAIGVDKGDLERCFAEDLDTGAARYRLKTLQRLDSLAGFGNASAAKQLVTMTSGAAADGAGADKSSAHVGKKAAAKADAAAAVASGGLFATRAGPRLAASGGKIIPDGGP